MIAHRRHAIAVIASTAITRSPANVIQDTLVTYVRLKSMNVNPIHASLAATAKISSAVIVVVAKLELQVKIVRST